MKDLSHKTYFRLPFQIANTITETLRSPFPYYFDDERKNTALTAGFSLFLILFMLAVKNEFEAKILLMGVSTFFVLYVNVVWLPKLWPRFMDTPNWTVGKYIAFSLWQMLVCCIFLPVVCQVFGIGADLSLFERIVIISPKVLGYGIVPLIISSLLMHNHMLREGLRNAIRANRELGRIQELRLDPQHTMTNVVTIHSDTRESLELCLSKLLYVEANDNYSTFFWKTGDTVEKKMLRMNLKTVESQLDNYLTMRCHRSFIVNLNAISHVTGNANGYKLSIRDCNFSVPVSRAKGKEVIQKIEQMRSVIEMN